MKKLTCSNLPSGKCYPERLALKVELLLARGSLLLDPLKRKVDFFPVFSSISMFEYHYLNTYVGE